MSCSFTSNDKLAIILSETSTLLVESSDSYSQLALEQSHKHILSVFHRSLPVPQSNAIALIPAPSTPSVISSARGLVMPRAFAPVRARYQHPTFSGYFPHCHSQNPPRSFTIDSQSSTVSGTEPVISPADFIRSSS